MARDDKQLPDFGEYDDEFDNGDCWQCGGDGYVSNCFEEFACLYPDEGCDLCTRRCDVCNPAPRKSATPSTSPESTQ